MTRLYLITHAHTAQQPSLDARLWRLSSRGEEQAALLAQQSFWSEVGLLVVSTEAKTFLTAAPAAAHWQLPLVFEPRFDELRRVGWEEDYAGTVRAAVFAMPDRGHAGWEPAGAALQRFLAGIAALPSAHAGRAVALVSHGLVLSLYRAKLLGKSHVDPADWKRLGFAAVAKVDLTTELLEHDFAAIAGEAPGRGE